MSEDAYLSIEDRNYARDPRVTARPVEIPAGAAFHWQVCDLCKGRAKVVNPSIDCGGLTREDFDEDPDFAEGYRSGLYDITCPRCLGRSTIPVLDDPRPRCSLCGAAYDAYRSGAFCQHCGCDDCDHCPRCCAALAAGEQPCTNPAGHHFVCTGVAYGGDDESYFGEGRCICEHCGADGDA